MRPIGSSPSSPPARSIFDFLAMMLSYMQSKKRAGDGESPALTLRTNETMRGSMISMLTGPGEEGT